MQLTAAIERLERVVSTRSDCAAVPDDLTAALRASKELGSFLAAALDEATVTPGHVDAVTRGAKGLEAEQRRELFERSDELVDVAAGCTVDQFSKRIRTLVNRIIRDGGESRLARQRRATAMSTWTDDDGMWNVRGRFDPVTALSLSAALDRAVETLFAETVPDTCPSDPIEKQKHLRAFAFARLVQGTTGGGHPGRPEFVAVLDLDNLLPVCVHHHHQIHDTGWNITLGPNREPTITLPDRTIHNTGPPQRHAA